MGDQPAQPANKKPCSIWRLLGIILILSALSYSGYAEYSLAKHISTEYDIIANSYILPTDEKVYPEFNRDVVILQSTHFTSHPAYAPNDFQFNIMLGTRMVLHRKVEFCQWHEYIPQGEGEDMTPQYYKAWTDDVIDSSTFQVQEGHVNNLRKPLKELLLEPRYIQARSFRIDYAYFKNLSLPFIPTEMTVDNADLPTRTKQLGFYYLSKHWYYSKASMEGLGKPLLQENVTFIDEETESEMDLNCETGDIRVGHEYINVPREMTIVGVQNDDFIKPVRTHEKVYPLVFPGNRTVSEMVDMVAGENGRVLRLIRVGAGVVVVVGMIWLKGIHSPFPYMPHIIRSIIVAILGEYIVTLGIWILFYGCTMEFVLRTLIWFGAHFFLAILINIMFYMIRLYRFAMMLEKEKQKKKKKEE